ncbi:MAG: nucleotidyltransferase substrate binding protein, partial [Prevotellaceae bacterium]|nr:nucleotidyltransferase substrate binding protein [Prevotellaceae bacterium]
GLLADGEVWMDMITSRNYTSHNYDGDIADMMVSKVADVYYPEMLKFHDVMKAKDPCFLLKITLKSAE